MAKLRRATNLRDTFVLLDAIMTELGSTKVTLWPFLEASEDELYSYKGSVHTLTCGGDADEPFHPFKHIGGIHSLSLDAAENQYLLGEDHADFEFGNGTADSAFSVGCWILPRDITSVALLAKWDDEGAAEDREWLLWLNASSQLELVLEDESADADERATGSTALTANQWTFVVATYDGDQATPDIHLYLNADDDNPTGASTESGTYTAMEAGAETLTIGASLTANVAANEFTGRIALPFICGKELSAAEVATIYNASRKLLGL